MAAYHGMARQNEGLDAEGCPSPEPGHKPRHRHPTTRRRLWSSIGCSRRAYRLGFVPAGVPIRRCGRTAEPVHDGLK